MGLDNGLILVTTNKIQMDELPEYIAIEDNNWRNENEKYDEGYYYDICYWRKWWKLRHFILSLDNIEKGKIDGEYILDLNHITQIQKKEIEYLCHLDEWDDYWFPEDIICQLAQDIVNLSWLKDYIMNHKFTKIIFYDSY